MSFQVDKRGYYGQFGGSYIPEMLYPNVEELREKYLDIIYDPVFQKEFDNLLKDYVGRPTPLYKANRLSEKYKATVYLKREDLCHTGAHKINNTIGQILLAKRLGKQKSLQKREPDNMVLLPQRSVHSWAWSVGCIWANWIWNDNGLMWNACGYLGLK